MRNVSDRICEEYETHIFLSSNHLPKLVPFFERMWKEYGTAVMATDHSMIRLMQFACWVNKATDKQNNTFCLLFLGQQYVKRMRINCTLYVHYLSPSSRITALEVITLCLGLRFHGARVHFGTGPPRYRGFTITFSSAHYWEGFL